MVAGDRPMTTKCRICERVIRDDHGKDPLEEVHSMLERTEESFDSLNREEIHGTIHETRYILEEALDL